MSFVTKRVTTSYLIYVFSIILVFNSFMVTYSQHPVFSLLFLISSFILSAFILFTLECEFLALIFITIYVGAIAILFLFSIMMLDTKLINLLGSTTEYIPIGVFLGLMFLIPLVYEIFTFFWRHFALYIHFLKVIFLFIVTDLIF